MARGTYIYLVFKGADLLSAHTVKYEAHNWVRRSRWDFDQVTLHRMRDGDGRWNNPCEGFLSKQIDDIDWELSDDDKARLDRRRDETVR